MTPAPLPSATFTGLRTGLHLLLVGLTVLAIVRVVMTDEGDAVAVLILALFFLTTYALGHWITRRTSTEFWLLLLTVEWFGLVWLTPEAGYLVFPLFFLSSTSTPCPRGSAQPQSFLQPSSLSWASARMTDSRSAGSWVPWSPPSSRSLSAWVIAPSTSSPENANA